MDSANAKNPVAKYVLLIIGACLLYVIVYFTSTAVSLFYDSICADLGFELAALKVYYSIAMFVGLFSAPIMLKTAFPKLGGRKMVLLFGTVGGLAYMAMGLASQLWHWYVLATIVGLTLSSGISTVAVILINKWFLDKTGMFIGIASAMTGVAGIVFSSMLGKIISSNWHNGYFFAGAVILVCIWISGIFCIRDTPQSCGCQPYGLAKYMEKQKASVGQRVTMRGVMLKNAMKSVPFWSFFIGNVIFGFLLAFTQSSVGFFMEQGFSLVEAAGFLGWLSGSLIVWKLVLGWMADKISGRWTFMVALAITLIGFALQLLVGSASTVVPYIFIICYGCGISTISVLNNVCVREMFGTIDLQGILPMIGIAAGVSNAVCVMLWEVVYGVTGSYTTCAVLAAATTVIFAVFLFVSYMGTKTARFQSMVEEKEM